MLGLVLTAAGSSTRMGPGPSKVLRLLAGTPVLVRAAAALREAFPGIRMVVTVRAEDRAAVEALCREEPALRGAAVVAGGASRQESVARGLAALPPDLEIVLVHDAARPLVTPALARRVVEAARRDGAAAPALPLTSSVHRTDASGRLVEALPREALRAVQTPQAARATALRDAFALAARLGTEATDEVGLLLAAGVPVTAVEGDPENLKVTTPADLAEAEAILARRRG